MIQPSYSSKSTPILFADARSAELWQQHNTDGRSVTVDRDEFGYIRVRPADFDYLADLDVVFGDIPTTLELARRFYPVSAFELDETPLPVCGGSLARIADAYARSFESREF